MDKKEVFLCASKKKRGKGALREESQKPEVVSVLVCEPRRRGVVLKILA